LGSRRKSRELAVQILYQLELNKAAAERGLEPFWDNFPHPDDVKEFAGRLVAGVLEHRKEIDRIITQTSKNWAFNRIAPVDLGILRMAVFEICFCEDIPYKVTLNEAIELGKKFGTEKSGAFINGVLDNVLDKHAEKKKEAG
jgi:N utilization substance protein B